MFARHTKLALLVTLFTTLLAPVVAADDSDNEESQPEIWYQVEVVIFEQVDRFNAEAPVHDATLSYPKHYQELYDPRFKLEAEAVSLDAHGNLIPNDPTDSSNSDDIDPEIEQATGPQEEQPFWQLPATERQLNNDAAALDRQGGYRVLYHQAWRQPGISPRYAPWILVRGGNRFEQHFELEGSIRLIRSRYLHIETNLWLTRFSSDFGQEAEVWPELPTYPVIPLSTERSSETSLYDAGVNSDPQDILTLENTEPAQSDFVITQVDTLKTSRRMKRNEIHYLDHPRMGVLVKVTAYKLPEIPPADEPAEPSTATATKPSAEM